jgi:hypothetical protein
MVNKGRARVTVTTDGDTLVGTVGDERKDVVQLVGHTTRLGYVADRSGAVELGRDDVVHHPTRVTNPEAARLDTTNGSGTDNEDTLLLGLPEDLTSMTLGNTLSDESNGLDLRVLKALEGARVYTTAGSKVDDNIDVRVLGSSILDAGVDRKESLLGSPIELLDVVTTEGVNHGSDGRACTTAGVVKVKHALDGTGLETIDEGAGTGVERPKPGAGGRRLFGLKVDNLVFGLCTATIGMNGANSGLGFIDGSNLRGRSARLDTFQTVMRNSLGLGDVNAQCEGDNLGDVGIGAEDADGNAKALSEKAHRLETLLIVWTTTTDEDLDTVADKLVLVLLEGTDDTLEGSSDVGEVGNTTTDDEDLALGTRGSTSDEIDY